MLCLMFLYGFFKLPHIISLVISIINYEMYTCIKHTVQFKFVNYLKLKYYVIHVGNVLKQHLSHFNNSILNDCGVWSLC